MITLKNAVKRYFPQEVVLKGGKAKVSEFWSTKIGKVPIGVRKLWYLTPVEFIETDKKFYFDRRQSLLRGNKISSGIVFIIFLLLLSLAYYAFYNLALFIICLIFLLTTIFYGPLVFIFNYKINQGLTNILTIKRDWVKCIQFEKEKRIISGHIPSRESWLFTYYLTEKQKETLSFLPRFLSQRKSLVSGDFKITYTLL